MTGVPVILDQIVSYLGKFNISLFGVERHNDTERNVCVGCVDFFSDFFFLKNSSVSLSYSPNTCGSHLVRHRVVDLAYFPFECIQIGEHDNICWQPVPNNNGHGEKGVLVVV